MVKTVMVCGPSGSVTVPALAVAVVRLRAAATQGVRGGVRVRAYGKGEGEERARRAAGGEPV